MSAGNLIFLLVILVIFGVLFTSQRRRQRAVMHVQQQLEPGTRVMTTAGLFATVVAVDAGDVDLEVAPGVVCRYARQAIARIVSDGEPDIGRSDGFGGDPSDQSPGFGEPHAR